VTGVDGISAPMVLLAGVVSFASPCFLPVVPVFVGYLVGQDGAGPASGRRRFAAAGQATAFVAAFSLVFVLLWTLVGLVGWVVGDYRDVLRVAGGAVLILLGLHTAELIRVPWADRTLRAPYAPPISEPPAYRRSALLGLAFGAGWTPCIGPILGGVLGLATRTGSVAGGAALLVVYALGLGVPFVLICAGAGGLTRRLSWFARHHRAVGVVSGALLVAVGFLMVADLFARVAGLTSIVI
jgi:cytochrome c-type biogenesis protein